MTTAVASEAMAKAVAAFAAVSELAGCSLTGLAEDELLEVLRLNERTRRTLAAIDNTSIPELETRNLPAKHMMRGAKEFLSGLLNLSPSESGARVRQARELGSRIQLTGEILEPLLPVTAAARAAGSITTKQVDVIIQAIGKLRGSDAMHAAELAEAEIFLVEQAQLFDALTLSGIARRLLDTLDPDGTLGDERGQQRRRFLSCVPSGDGMHRLTADLDAETAALAMTVLHSLSAPRTAENAESGESGERDQRTAGQRMHDAFRAVLKLALRSAQLPSSGGLPATVLITMTAEQFETRTGLAATSFGQRLTIDQALRIGDQAAIAWIVHDSVGGILNYGQTRRIATDKQTLALIARDKGCAFPGCASPPEWTERHHVLPWSQGGHTNLDNLCLLCDWHHDRIDSHDWRVAIQDGVPWFVPPAWLDPNQKPQRNSRP